LSKIAFLFPGQGAQSIGMGQAAYDALPAVQELFSRANDVLGYDLAEICFRGPEEKLNSTVISQPALYVCSFAAIESLKETNPEVVEAAAGAAGLSLGEYTAIAFAGGISFEDGLKLVQRRGEAMQQASDATTSGMVSILGLDRDKVDEVCEQARNEEEILQPANYLCPGNIAVSGHRDSCANVAAIAEAAGALKIVPLSVAGAFHTELMRSAVDKLAAALNEIEIVATRIPVYSNVDAAPHTDPDEIRSLLIEQVCSPVLWQDCMQNMMDDGYDRFFEVGAGRVLRGLLKRITRKMRCEGTLN
jgi:[acyl-carrier-protein] S-malonyltransferase